MHLLSVRKYAFHQLIIVVITSIQPPQHHARTTQLKLVIDYILFILLYLGISKFLKFETKLEKS